MRDEIGIEAGSITILIIQFRLARICSLLIWIVLIPTVLSGAHLQPKRQCPTFAGTHASTMNESNPFGGCEELEIRIKVTTVAILDHDSATKTMVICGVARRPSH
jgi:hypothetical protein